MDLVLLWLYILIHIYRATKSVNAKSGLEDENVPPPVKVQDVKAARTLASEITQTGAKLYDLLATEASER
jgi:Na+-transporting methylmalonyl-CoA/oxaloacetate decarboxylase gamma subunit